MTSLTLPGGASLKGYTRVASGTSARTSLVDSAILVMLYENHIAEKS